LWVRWALKPFSQRSRFDRRFYAVGALVLATAIAAKLLGADDFHAYPTIRFGFGPATVALSTLLVLSGLAPLRRKPKRLAAVPGLTVQPPPRGPGAASISALEGGRV
jgi:hypothetical protein